MNIVKVLFLYVIIALGFVQANTNEYKWIEGKLDTVYSSNYNSTTAQGSVEYFISVSKIKMVKLDMSSLPVTNKWQALVGKNVELKVTKANYADVLVRKVRAYVVLDVRYKPVPQSKNRKEKALVVDNAKKPWLNLLCKFADIVTEPHPSSFYQTMFGNTYPYLEHYWKETTYGLIDISGTQTMDWVTLPHNHDYYKPVGENEADYHLIKEDCVVAAGGTHILDSYYGLNIFVNGTMFDNWAGRGGGGTTWIDLGAESSIGTVAHEMGHAYGLPHSSGRYGSNYDSPWDVMSNAHRGASYGDYNSIAQHTIAFHKQKLGAININAQWSNAKVDASGGELIHLSRLEESAVAGDYLIANIYSTDGTKHYTVEARDKIGYDSPLPAKAVVIHEIEDGPFGFRAYVLDSDNNGNLSDAGVQWQVGETFTDSNNSISIEIDSSTATGYNIRITAAQVKPAEVTGITATTNLLEKVRVSWMPSQGAEYYKVLRYEGWDINGTHETFTMANNNTYYDDVPDDASYYVYRVKACNVAGCSALAMYDYDGGSRPRVHNVTASNDQINNIHLTWDVLDGATSYKVIRYDDYQETTNRQEYTVNGTSYDDAVSDANYYYYKIQACNSNGCSPESYRTSGRRAVVQNISASSDQINDIHVTWDALDGATYYKVLRYDSWSVDSNYTEFSTGNSDAFYDDVPTDINTHYYRVKACNSTGCSLLGSSYAQGKKIPLQLFEKSDSVTVKDFKYYTIDAFGGEKINVLLTNLSADIDLYVQIGSKPTTGSFACKSAYGGTSQEECTITLNNDATVHIGAYGYEAGNFTLNVGATGELKDTDADGVINHLDTDDDNDGISDSVEIANGLDPLNASDAQTDLDKDGFSNAIEILVGTKIKDASSKPIWIPVMMDDIATFIAVKP